MDQQVDVTIKLTLSVDAELDREAIDAYVFQNVRFSNNCQFHLMELKINSIQEEAEIYSYENHCNHEKNCTKNS